MLMILIFLVRTNVLGILVSHTIPSMLIITIYDRCFPHVVNLAVQAVLNSITNMAYAHNDADMFFPQWAPTCDIIALLRTLINKVRDGLSSHLLRVI
jgi:hypothetical protein